MLNMAGTMLTTRGILGQVQGLADANRDMWSQLFQNCVEGKFYYYVITCYNCIILLINIILIFLYIFIFIYYYYYFIVLKNEIYH